MLLRTGANLLARGVGLMIWVGGDSSQGRAIARPLLTIPTRRAKPLIHGTYEV